MSTFSIVILIAVGLFVLFKVKSGFSKYKAAQNALLAKYTFEALDPEGQKRVAEQTKSILSTGGISEGEDRVARLEDREKYGFYALAMAELNIPPALSDYDWQFVKNPFVALLNADTQIQAAKRQLSKSDGVEVDI